MQFEAGMFQARRRGQRVHGKRHFRGFGFPTHRIEPRWRATHHARDQLLVRRGSNRSSVHTPSVAKHGVAIRNLPDLLEEVADVDDGNTARCKAPDEREQAFHVGALQCARGLVHQHDARVGRQGSTDFHYLAGGKRQFTDAPTGTDLRVRQLFQQRQRAFPGAPPVNHASPRQLPAKEHVFFHGEVRAQRQLLVDECNTAPPRVVRGGRRVVRTLELHCAAIRALRTGEHGHQGALARAVLADERMHLTGVHLEVHAIERDGRAVPLRDSFDAKHGAHPPPR